MKRKPLAIMLLTAFLTIMVFGTIGTEKAYACSCVPFESYATAMDNSTHVVDATVKGIANGEAGYFEVSLDVAAVWKGEATAEMQVLTEQSSASCGYHFELSKRYAVFAYENKDKLHVSLCSATSLLSDDSPVIEELGEPKPIEAKEESKSGTSPTDSDTSGDEEQKEELSPDQIKLKVTEKELEERLESQKSQLTIVFVSVGGVLLLGALVLLIIRIRGK